MAFLENYIGDVQAVYTATQYTKGATPRVGDWFYDGNRKAKFVFLKNLGSGAIAAKTGAVSLTTDRAAYGCRAPSTTITANELLFAGFRVSGATSMAQNEHGWFQVSGSLTVTASSDTTTADLGVVFSNQTAGTVEAAADSAAGIRGTFGVAATTTASGDVVVHLNYNVWGI